MTIDYFKSLSPDSLYEFLYLLYYRNNIFEILANARKILIARSVCLKDPRFSYIYALNLTKGRIPKSEPIIATDSGTAWLYCTNVLKPRQRWNYFQKYFRPEFLETWSFTEREQEYICIHHPDLIAKIYGLNYNLKEKYSHELNLSRIEV